MNRLLRNGMCMFVGVLLLGGCTSSKSETITFGDQLTYNSTYNAKNMETITGKTVSMEDADVVAIAETGVGVKLPKSISEDSHLDVQSGTDVLVATYQSDYSQEIATMDISGLSEEETFQLVYEYQMSTYYLFSLVGVTSADQETVLSNMSHYFTNQEELGTVGEVTWYFFSQQDLSMVSNLTEEDQATITRMWDALPEVRDNLILYNAEVIVNGSMESFTTTTLEGEAVDSSIFADYDLTVVNIWTTWCTYCIEEMPELEELYKTLPEGVNMISIVADGAEESELAKQMVKEKGLTYPVLLPSESIQTNILTYVTGYPSTFYVDKTGKVVGEWTIGVPNTDAGLVQAYLNAIEEHRKLVK